MHCLQCELKPVAEINGEKLCDVHVEQRVEFSEREAPPIAMTRHVPMHPQSGARTSGTPRHYK